MVSKNFWTKFANNLIERGSHVNPGRSAVKISDELSHINQRFDKRIIDIYCAFDGHKDGDFDLKSEISFWNFDKSVYYLKSEYKLGINLFPICDFAVMSDIYFISLDNIDIPLWSRRAQRSYKQNIVELAQLLVSNELDDRLGLQEFN